MTNYVNKTDMEEQFENLAQAVVEKKIKKEDGIPTRTIDLARCPPPPKYIPDEKKNQSNVVQ